VREYSDGIKLPKCYPSPVVGGGYRISNFLMAKEVIVKKKLQDQCPTIKYYENTKYALNRNVRRNLFYGIYFNKFHSILQNM
jgi:hypothetical protein